MTYSPRYQKQGDGSRCQWQNCNPTSNAMAVDRSTRGAKVGSPSVIRNKINLFCPGTSFAQNRDAVGPLYGVTMEYHFGLVWDDFVSGVKAGRGAAVGIMYSVVHGTPYDASPNFNGRHAIYVNQIRHNTTLNRDEAQVYDPLADHRLAYIPQGPQWWPLTLLKKAMVAWATDMEGAFTKNTEWVNRAVKCGPARLRVGPHAGDALKASVAAGTVLYTATLPVVGGNWGQSFCGTYKSGNQWYEVTAIGGKSVSSLYGVNALYVCEGWM